MYIAEKRFLIDGLIFFFFKVEELSTYFVVFLEIIMQSITLILII